MFEDLPIAGINKMTTVDFPGHLSAVVFLQGCPWRCPYCHNPEMQKLTAGVIPFEELKAFLKKRKGLLDGIVYSGGDPLVYSKLSELIKWTKEQGFDVAIHTGGHLYENFEKCLKYVDWVGFDMKAPFAAYEKITKAKNSGEYAKKAMQMLLASGVNYEIRTTASPDDLTMDDIYQIAKDLKELGVKNYVLQEHRHLPDEEGDEITHFAQNSSFFVNKDLISFLENSFENFSIRRA